MPQPQPVIAGVAQFNPRAEGLPEAPEPLAMLEKVARGAAEDAGSSRILDSIDVLAVVNVVSARYQNAPDALASQLGIAPKRKLSTTFGGNTPQTLVNYLAREIAAGKIRAAMIVGAEAIYTARHAAKRGGVKWNFARGEGEPEVFGDARMGTNAYEERHGAKLPIHIYPMFENAYRARNGWSLAEHRERMGKLWAAMTSVAAQNPHAWFPKQRTASEITTITADNRIICFPYTKMMNSIMEVDLAAGVIIASAEEARRAGVAKEKLVHIHSVADATDSWWISERDTFSRPTMLNNCIKAALDGAQVSSNDVSHFDFYSCFPIAVELAMEAAGLVSDDPRGPTVTGGLPFAGGPANNYVTHSISAMTGRLRAHPGQLGMTTGLGWYFTKHGAAIYSTREPEREMQSAVFKEPERGAVKAVDQAEGAATVETYTVEHDRSGEPSAGIVVGRLAGGERFFARTPREVLKDIEREEFVGRPGRVRNADGVNLFEPR
jgi:acetyl-CoA C-acetyltransferase